MNGLLFIDDEEGVRRSIVRALKKEPYKTYTAGNGEEGIKFIEENIDNISTVISDYKMPGLNGIDLLHRIKGKYPEMPVVLITGFSTDSVVDDIDQADGFLKKPFNIDSIITLLDQLSTVCTS